MRTFIMPGEIGREIKAKGFKEAAKTFGMNIAQLNEVIEKHGMTEWKQIDITGMFPVEPKQPRTRRDPHSVQALLNLHPRHEVADMLGITIGTLNNFISQNRLDAPTRKKEIPTREELEPLLEDYTLAEIGDLFAVTPTTVGRWIKAHGLKSMRTREIEARRKYDFRAMLLEGLTVHEIAKKAGLDVATVIRGL